MKKLQADRQSLSKVATHVAEEAQKKAKATDAFKKEFKKWWKENQ